MKSRKRNPVRKTRKVRKVRSKFRLPEYWKGRETSPFLDKAASMTLYFGGSCRFPFVNKLILVDMKLDRCLSYIVIKQSAPETNRVMEHLGAKK